MRSVAQLVVFLMKALKMIAKLAPHSAQKCLQGPLRLGV